jgi:hypothetical protein
MIRTYNIVLCNQQKNKEEYEFKIHKVIIAMIKHEIYTFFIS